MRIGIDLSIYRDRQGTEIFAENVLRNLLPLAKQAGDTVVVFCVRGVLDGLESELSEYGARVYAFEATVSGVSSLWRQQVVVPLLVFKYRLSALYSPSPFFSFLAPCRIYATIFDIAFLTYPEFKSRVTKAYFYACIVLAKYRCSRIFTASEFTAQQLRGRFGISPVRVVVLPGGAPAQVVVTIDTALYLQGVGIQKPYFLYIGITRPRKNLVALLEAFAQSRAAGVDAQLVLAGKIDTAFVDIAHHIHRLSIAESVIQLGRVTDEQKHALLERCMALVYPSLYEGYGLPVLEAQSAGAPVVTSNVTSIPEVAGGAVVFCDPHSISSIANALQVVTKPTVQEELRTKGRENVLRFSWAKTAQSILQAIRGSAIK